VLEAALDPGLGRSIETIAQHEGGQAALAVLKERASRFQGFDGWVPCSELRINELGYECIGQKAFEQAAQVLAINIYAFPGSWNAWDSYGEALAGAGHPEEALRAYGHALELNPGDSDARNYLNRFSR
jgi:tetratricopeptide (TPR) repeat protein